MVTLIDHHIDARMPILKAEQRIGQEWRNQASKRAERYSAPDAPGNCLM